MMTTTLTTAKPSINGVSGAKDQPNPSYHTKLLSFPFKLFGLIANWGIACRFPHGPARLSRARLYSLQREVSFLDSVHP